MCFDFCFMQFKTYFFVYFLFSFFGLQVNRVLEALEKPYSDAHGLEPLDGSNACSEKEEKARELTAGYVRKPPTWAQKICIT